MFSLTHPTEASDPVTSELSALLRLHAAGIHALQNGNAGPLYEELLTTLLPITRAEFGLVSVIDPETRQLSLAAHQRCPGPLVDPSGPGTPGREIAEVTLLRSDSGMSRDIANDESYSELTRDIILGSAATVLLSVPLIARKGTFVGVVCLFYSRENVPGPAEQRRAELIATQAADFVECAWVQQALQRRMIREQLARSEAEAANRRKDLFLATLSHELRQPLAAVLPAIEVQNRSLSPERRQRAGEVIQQQLRQIARLVEDLADISHINRGTLELRRETVDLRGIVEHAVTTTATQFESKQQITSVELGTDPAWVWADVTRLRQVFSNLLQNASAYTPQGGEIAIDISVRDGQAIVRLRDNGVGIPPEALSRIFEIFERGLQQNVSLSLGIGLAVVRQVIELHGGRVSASSPGINRGSEFLITLPLHQRNHPTTH